MTMKSINSGWHKHMMVIIIPIIPLFNDSFHRQPYCKMMMLKTLHNWHCNYLLGIVERCHQMMESVIKKCMDRQEDWYDMLNSVLLGMRSQVHSSTGYSPIRMLYNKDPLLPFQLPQKPKTYQTVMTVTMMNVVMSLTIQVFFPLKTLLMLLIPLRSKGIQYLRKPKEISRQVNNIKLKVSITVKHKALLSM